MAVTHLSSVANFLKVLDQGGTHRFLLTPDELPGVTCTQLAEDEDTELTLQMLTEETVWYRLARQIHDRGGTCIYRKNAAGECEVKVVIPPPRHDG